MSTRARFALSLLLWLLASLGILAIPLEGADPSLTFLLLGAAAGGELGYVLYLGRWG